MSQVEIKRRQIQLVSYIIGLITIWIMGRNIGANGITYLAAALEGFLMLWCVMGKSIPDTLGRLLRGRSAKGQFKNASRMRRNIFFWQCILGILGSIVFFCLAGVLSEQIFRVPYSRFLIMIIAPLIFIRSISAVLLGCFQGNGTELPTAVYCILKQVLLLGFGLFFCRLFQEYGRKVSALLGQETFTSMYGGMGIVLAMVLTELLMVLFLLVIYKGSRQSKAQKDMEGMRATDSFGNHIGLLYRHMSGKLLLGVLESLPLWLGLIFYQKSTLDAAVAADSYGIYFGEYLVICGCVVAFCTMLSVSANGRIAGSLRKEEQRYAKVIFQGSLKLIALQALFFSTFVAVMSKQLAGIFGGNSLAALEEMLSFGSLLIVFGAFALFFSRLLQLLGGEHLVLGCAGIADVMFVIVLMVMLNAGKLDVQALVYAGVCGSGVYAVLTGILVCRQMRAGIDLLHTIAIPAGASCVMGLMCLLLGKVFTPHLGNPVTVVVCLVLGTLVYWALALLFRCFREHELEAIPGGKLMTAIGQMLHVLV